MTTKKEIFAAAKREAAAKHRVDRAIAAARKEYGVRWRAFAARSGRLVTREKFFATEKALTTFCIKLEETDGFYEFDSWLYPPTHEAKE